MQALGGGTVLFLGLATGLGSAVMVRGHIVPMEPGGCLSGAGHRGRLRSSRAPEVGEKKWREAVAFWVKRLTSALLLDDVVIGGGNARELEHRPPASG